MRAGAGAPLLRASPRIAGEYWGGNLRYFDMKPGDGSAVYDSAYDDVGRWSIVDAPETGAGPPT